MVWVRIGRVAALVGAVIAIVGTFLPWAAYSGQGTTGFFQVGGVAVIMFGVLSLAFVSFGRARGLPTIVLGLLVVVFAVPTVHIPDRRTPSVWMTT